MMTRHASFRPPENLWPCTLLAGCLCEQGVSHLSSRWSRTRVRSNQDVFFSTDARISLFFTVSRARLVAKAISGRVVIERANKVSQVVFDALGVNETG